MCFLTCRYKYVQDGYYGISVWLPVAKVFWVFFKCVAIGMFRMVTRAFQCGCKVISLCCYVVARVL